MSYKYKNPHARYIELLTGLWVARILASISILIGMHKIWLYTSKLSNLMVCALQHGKDACLISPNEMHLVVGSAILLIVGILYVPLTTATAINLKALEYKPNYPVP